ncbi:hypothetical protein ALQ20_05431 [Pseudomonas syringae pv. atrofaciens]|uniref:ORC-CDC6 family AAA ATPase n=1 Tax=Pseudomonas syringae TaxID=317 RepID=UPI000F00D75F|nr:hypothetical protein [Pseudomonas syringae]RMP72537.1 hypothetical protein ALQ20_05431 [Pseudomonas syringae pv. atrofaciens]
MLNDHAQRDENPFDLTKASDFSDTQIFNYWVDIVEEHGGLLTVLNLKSVMPMLLLGGKGSGKTHLMRYCSAPVQSLRHNGSLSSAVNHEGYLGIYVSADGLNVGRFAGKGQTQETWTAIFGFYFELWLALNLISIVISKQKSEPIEFDEQSFTKEIFALFDTPPQEIETLDSLYNLLEKTLRKVDSIVNNSSVTRTLNGLEITFSPGRLCFGIPSVISKYENSFSNATFVYLIDEIENLSEEQQKFLNSLIRYRKGNATLRVGARLYGIKTYATLGSGEPIKRNSEYERIELDSFLRGHEKEYAKLAEELVVKRLNSAHTGILEFKDVSSFFEAISPTNFYQELTSKLSTSRKSLENDRPYFEKLKGNLSQVFGKESEKKIHSIIELLRADDFPLIEKLNILQLYKKWGDPRQIHEAAVQINQDSNELIKKSTPSRDYTQTFEHFDSDLLAQLFRDYSRKIPYAGLDTLIHLSQGVPRNLLGVLKQIYRRSLFAGEKPFAGGIISLQSQTEGVMDSAVWFWDDAQPDSYGTEVRDAVERLAILLRSIRYSDKPSECDLCSFSVDESKISDHARLTLERAENWSYLLKIRDGAKNKNTQSVDSKFQLSPMLAPKWGLSVHRRGTLEIRPDFANSIFDNALSSNFDALLKSRISAMSAPYFSSKASSDQQVLF